MKNCLSTYKDFIVYFWYWKNIYRVMMLYFVAYSYYLIKKEKVTFKYDTKKFSLLNGIIEYNLFY